MNELHHIKGNVTKVAHVDLPAGTFEEEHGRRGFFGQVSHLYHKNPPTGWTRIEGECRPQAFYSLDIKGEGTFRNRLPILENSRNRISIATISTTEMSAFRNADGEEVMFVHEGTGILMTDFGPMPYRRGDYLLVPRAVTNRMVVETTTKLLVIESLDSEFREPDRGILGRHALYDPAVLFSPDPTDKAPSWVTNPKGEWEIKVLRGGKITQIFYPFDPFDVVGWKGNLSTYRLNIEDFRPIICHRQHLAPSVHSTFVTDSLVICSFVPRPLEEEKGAVRVPFYHRNSDFDEVIFYHDGDFFSRDGVKPGMVTFHPQGVHHGPHPKAMAAALTKDRTNEYAVMVDTRYPLTPTDFARSVEWKDYIHSWKTT